jgi:hypothetical protein
MTAWRKLLASASIAAGSLVVLGDVRDGVVDVPAGLVLVVALAVLVRTAMRSASDPLPQDAGRPPRP